MRLFEEGHHFLTAHEGQDEIEDEEVVGDRLQKLDRGGAGSHALDAEPFALENAADEIDDGVVIFNHERAIASAPLLGRVVHVRFEGSQGHRPLSPTACRSQ